MLLDSFSTVLGVFRWIRVSNGVKLPILNERDFFGPIPVEFRDYSPKTSQNGPKSLKCS